MSISLPQYLLYLQYMLAGVAMTVVFGAVYLRITPAEELRLIKGATEELIGNNVAVGALYGTVSVSIGILNAACLT